MVSLKKDKSILERDVVTTTNDTKTLTSQIATLKEKIEHNANDGEKIIQITNDAIGKAGILTLQGRNGSPGIRGYPGPHGLFRSLNQICLHNLTYRHSRQRRT